MRAIDWCFRDRRTGRIVIGQWPNWSLWLFGIASLVDLVTASSGPVGVAARLLASVFLAIWAADELLRGVNPWRRALGAGVLIWMAVNYAMGL